MASGKDELATLLSNQPDGRSSEQLLAPAGPRQFMALCLLALLVTACANPPSKSAQTSDTQTLRKISNLPTTCSDAAEHIYTELDEASVQALREVNKSDLDTLHLSWGVGIRSSLGLWDRRSPIRKSCAQLVGEDDMHADDAANLIMGMVWDRVHAAT